MPSKIPNYNRDWYQANKDRISKKYREKVGQFLTDQKAKEKPVMSEADKIKSEHRKTIFAAGASAEGKLDYPYDEGGAI